MNTRYLCCAALLCVVAISGCGDPAADAAAQAAATAAANKQAANENAAAFEQAVAQENWALAKAQGDVLIARYPDSAAADRIRPKHAEAIAKADAARQTRRLAGLWSYNTESVQGGEQLSAAIYARDDIDTDGSGERPVRLIFRDHPSWGNSSYLVLQAGDFDCYGGCRVEVRVDGGEPQSMAALRPDTDEAVAMFIEDERALWRMTRDADTIAIEIPTQDVGVRTAEFEVGGLDRNRLPDWE